MVKDILVAAGFVEGVTFKETRFLKAPRETYAVYMDSYDVWGSDDRNFIKDHEYTIELYSYKPDPGAERAIETSLDLFAVPYQKEERYWIEEEQLYQIIYTFSHVEK
ncbi:hypothetical protein AALA22_10670 [Anaerovoracaceae bacterium 41-7]|uniref:hypothetical protein n=1 Tax=Emergencia sp. JLR.KK010 TaxID=3114296 RepID=UPI0030CD31BE